ncbi:LIC10906 family membrane protein [Leptospira broomii]|nr:histidine kinase N-terminal 7TM domain-containing protein [Leptospira broomii]
MEAINLTPFLVSCFVFFLAYYVYTANSSTKRIPNSFWLLSTTISLWLFILAFRGLTPIEWRGNVLNWTLVPAILIPSFLFSVVKSILNIETTGFKVLKIFDWFAIAFFLFEAIVGKIVSINDPYFFSYTPTSIYHLLIFYIFSNVGFSIYLMGKGTVKSRGSMRLQLVLMLIGIFVGLLVSLLFVYILPLMGIFRADLSSFGIGIYVILWSIAILQYDAFEMKAQWLSGKKIPFLIRFSLPLVLLLYHLADPVDYDRKLLDTRAQIANSLIEFNYELVARTSLEGDEKSRVIAAQFSRYFK